MIANAMLTLTPEASLNRLPVTLPGEPTRPARHWVSTQALHGLMLDEDPGDERSVRQFLRTFDARNPQDECILTRYANRLMTVLKTALRADYWAQGSPFQQGYAHCWRQCQRLVLGGGLSSDAFGRALMAALTGGLDGRELALSPYGGQTGLVGLATLWSQPSPLLVMDFGATGIKRGLVDERGKLQSLPELNVDHWLNDDGLFRADAFQAVLHDSRMAVGTALPTAISLACYMKDGQPYDYRSGVYHRLIDDSPHLAHSLDQQWLPKAGLGRLVSLMHDSSAAALAFPSPVPAIMVTLGTGLGVGLCPLDDPTVA
ncbi:hypothetical protein BGP77_15060 [Saccharospirillum sp. MSK14-1]|uniref:hypothetical protein n=1 Tax=Saccharospirillum sp. MSK14-1 TaxID=1897632 RepID=UPI000D3A3587|nr:hypothetical protein [Saccharospirillum sp. MSK14-1]PTY37795.1 hypothetical protein BGP77_15060 [Saccharospirillum sp. MSK14-1]